MLASSTTDGYASAISLAFFVLVRRHLANRYFTRDKDVVR